MIPRLLLFPLALAGCGGAGGPPPAPVDARPLTAQELQTYPDARGVPADVGRFMIRWSDCQHFLSEPAWDSDRRRQLDEAVRDLCPGIDAEGAAVRRRHGGDPAVIRALARYDILEQE